MTQLSPSRVATMLDQTAALLAEHGAATTRRAHDLALGATHHSDGPGQRNAISDPTGTAATTPPDPLAGLERRWLLAMADLGAIAPPQPREGTQEARTAARLRDTAQRLNEGDRRLLGWLHELNRIAWELQHVIYECLPMDREQAHEELLERKHDNLNRAFPDCRACGVPIDKPENRKLGLYDQWCYKRIDRWRQVNPGLAIDDHHAEFCEWIRHHIANRIPGFDRPESIHSPIGRHMVPAEWTEGHGDPAA